MATSLMCSMSTGASWNGLAHRTELGVRLSTTVLALRGRGEGDRGSEDAPEAGEERERENRGGGHLARQYFR
jgi:hypothetical protein